MRIRTIKPEFWTHEGLCSCSEFTRLLAIALLNWADDHGYFLAHPNLIRGSLFPFQDDSKMIPGSLLELSRVGWIELGEDSQGRKVGRVRNFLKHQRVDKPQESKIKGSSTFQDHSKNDPGTIQEPSKEEGNGREGSMEGKGREREESAPGFSNRAVETSPPVSLETVMANAGQYGTTPEIAKAWWLKRDGIGWLERGQPITRWHSNLKAFADTWGGIENKPSGSKFGRPEASVSTTDKMPGYDF